MKLFGKVLIVFLALASAAWASDKEIDVTVNGMVCAFCAQGIEKKFHAQPSIDQVKVNLSDKRVRLDLKEGQSLDDATITKILTDSGYGVQKIERK